MLFSCKNVFLTHSTTVKIQHIRKLLWSSECILQDENFSIFFTLLNELLEDACVYTSTRGTVPSESKYETVVMQRYIRCIWMAFFLFFFFPIHIHGFSTGFFPIRCHYSCFQKRHYLTCGFCSIEGLVVISIYTADFHLKECSAHLSIY